MRVYDKKIIIFLPAFCRTQLYNSISVCTWQFHAI